MGVLQGHVGAARGWEIPLPLSLSSLTEEEVMRLLMLMALLAM